MTFSRMIKVFKVYFIKMHWNTVTKAHAEARILRKYTPNLAVFLKAISSGNLVEEARIALFWSPSLLFAPWVVSLAAQCCRTHFIQSPPEAFVSHR